MKNIAATIIFSTAFLVFHAPEIQACTVAVVSAKASQTGRPFLWKNRDNPSSVREEIDFEIAGPDNVGSILYAKGETFYLSNIKLVSGGLNENGFAIVSADVAEGTLRTITNANNILTEIALEQCATLRDFEDFLDSWSNYNLLTVCGNFPAIDAEGGAAIYEVWSDGTNRLMWTKYDANEDMKGFVVRANSHVTEGYVMHEGGSAIRYNRAMELFNELYENGDLSPRSVLQMAAKDVGGDCDKFADDCTACYKYDEDYAQGGPDPDNFNTNYTLSRNSSTSCYVIDGAAADEDLPLMTMYSAMGEPSFTPAVPYFIFGEKIPYFARAEYINIFGIPVDTGIGSMLNNASLSVLLDYDLYDYNGVAIDAIDHTIDYEKLLEVQAWVIPLEDIVFDKTEAFLDYLRANPEHITKDTLYEFSFQCAKHTYRNYSKGAPDRYQWTYRNPWER
ncbi:MAG TPA: hypothetical protein PK573_03680 [Spirochaetota bacterium]|nr:hypothetical protein [Spirochaetota bacterium]HRZ27337.1 hypothetical protein [Spirochaetota bacterium]